MIPVFDSLQPLNFHNYYFSKDIWYLSWKKNKICYLENTCLDFLELCQYFFLIELNKNWWNSYQRKSQFFLRVLIKCLSFLIIYSFCFGNPSVLFHKHLVNKFTSCKNKISWTVLLISLFKKVAETYHFVFFGSHLEIRNKIVKHSEPSN